MTLLVAGILLGIGVPNLLQFSRNASMTGAANDFVTAALQARTEAVKRQAPVTFCLSDDPLAATPTCAPGSVFGSLTRGWVVFVDENNNVDADGARILTDGTDGNAVIDAGELVLSQHAAPGADSSIRVSANCGYTSYGPNGYTRRAGALCWPTNDRNVLLCDDRGRRIAAGGLASARLVSINRIGRARVLSEFADVDPTVPSFPGANCN
jgi:Tfp pilus assembly protein FimT